MSIVTFWLDTHHTLQVREETAESLNRYLRMVPPEMGAEVMDDLRSLSRAYSPTVAQRIRERLHNSGEEIEI